MIPRSASLHSATGIVQRLGRTACTISLDVLAPARMAIRIRFIFVIRGPRHETRAIALSTRGKMAVVSLASLPVR